MFRYNNKIMDKKLYRNFKALLCCATLPLPRETADTHGT